MNPVNTHNYNNPKWSKKDTDTLRMITSEYTDLKEGAKQALDTFPNKTYTDIYTKTQKLFSKKRIDIYEKISWPERDIKCLEKHLFQNKSIETVIQKTASEIGKTSSIVHSRIFQNSHFFDILGLRAPKEEPVRTASPVKRKISYDDALEDSSAPKRITPSPPFDFLTLEDIQEIEDDAFLRSLEPSLFEKISDTDSPLLEK
jgi:hypothetical protein